MRSDSPITNVLATPQPAGPETDSLCATGLAPGLILSGVMLGICRQHFSTPSNILDPSLRSLIWKAATQAENNGLGTSATSPICIESVTKWNPNLVEHRPAVFVKRDARGSQRTIIGDRYQGGKFPGKDFVDKGDRYEVLIYGSYTFLCLGRTGAEAEALGVEVQLRLIEFGPLLRRDLNLMRFAVMDMSSVNIVEEAQQHFVVAVPVAYAFTHSWRLKPVAPLLKTADIRPQF